MTKQIFPLFSQHAYFSYELIQDVIVIYDLGTDDRSVTNDVSYVLEQIKKQVSGIGKKTIIYRDSTNLFDGIAVDKQGHHIGFYPIRETTLERALLKLNKRLQG